MDVESLRRKKVKYFYESISSEIVNYDQNEMIEAFTQAMSNENVLQHFLAVDNVYIDREFCDNNMFV